MKTLNSLDENLKKSYFLLKHNKCTHNLYTCILNIE